MSTLMQEGLAQEIEQRVSSARALMVDRGLDALLVYGNNKVNGALHYMSGYFPDRGGWLANGPTRADIAIFDAATLFVPLAGEPVLVFDKGQLLDREAVTSITTVNGFGGELASQPAVPVYVADLLRSAGATGRVGVETWDKFPTPFYLGLATELPGTEFLQSTVVEDLMLVKSDWEVANFRQCAAVGDLGHRAFMEAMRRGPGQTELELIRAAEAVMRNADPVYEEVNPGSPSLISSGKIGRLAMLHNPMGSKTVEVGDIVNWDLASRHRGYPIDTSRTRMLGKATPEQKRANAVAIEMRDEIIAAIRPGVQVQDLVSIADKIATAGGVEFYDRFIGHGLGLDVHQRPDMGMEEMQLRANMMITVEPRIILDGQWLMGNEDMVLVTESGADVLTTTPVDELEL